MSNKILITRLNKDIRVLKNDNINELGIYYHVCESDIRQIKWMIIGSTNTPYRYGYYFFDMQIPNDYPFSPPIVTFQTRTNNVRFNPNMYCCGKVCVSILNTWSGPQWTSCQSLKSVILSLQSLLNHNPLENEPGFQDQNTDKHEKYRRLIEHENFRFSIFNPLNHELNQNHVFGQIIKEQFLKDYINIKQDLEELIEKYIYLDKFESPVYNMTIHNQYDNILQNCNRIYNQFTLDTISVNNFFPIKYNHQKIFVPNKKAKDYEIGYQCLSENNNCNYKVILNKNNHKIWKKINE